MPISRWLNSIQRRSNRQSSPQQVSVRPPRSRLSCEHLEDRIVPQGSFSQDYVTQLYTDLLGRAVDSAGLSFWSGQIDGGESLTQVVTSIEASQEYRNDLVEQMYNDYLHRGVDSGSLSFWSGELSSESVEQVQASIIGSAEFYNDAGDTAQGFLNALYEDVLDRAPDPDGDSYYAQQLADGVSRTAVAYSVLTSVEYYTDLVDGYYEKFLHREADSGGQTFWVDQLLQGNSDQSVVAGFLTSAEYQDRIPAAPTVTSPSSTVTTEATSYTVTGTAESGSLIQVFSDGGVVASEQLTGEQTDYSISVPLTSNAVNDFTVTASNAFGSQSPAVSVPAITQNSNIVTVTAPSEQMNYEDDSVDLQVSGTDALGNSLTYTATGLPTNLTMSSSGLITGSIETGEAADSPYTVTVTATDSTDSSYTGTATFTWLVDTQNSITVTAPSNQTSFEGNDVSSLAVTATEGNTNPLTYSATGLPAGLSIDASTGVISGIIDPGDASASPYTINLSVTDGLVTGTASFTWTVYSVGAIAEQENNEQDVVTGLQAATTDTNAVTYSATGLPLGLNMSSSGLITGTIDSGDATGSPYTVTVTVTDSANNISGVTTFQWLVYGSSDPLLQPPATQLNENSDVVNSVAVTVGGTPASPVTYTASNLPSGLSINENTGVISGTISSSASDNSPYVVTVTATEGSAVSTATFDWVVTSGSTASLPYSLTSPGWATLPSGVRYLDLAIGSGTPAAVNDTITVNYVGYLTDGTVFDSGSAFSSTLSTSYLIAGWVDGVPGMMPGGVRLLDIPASLAYGSSGSSGADATIPANAELIFEVTLTSATSS